MHDCTASQIKHVLPHPTIAGASALPVPDVGQGVFHGHSLAQLRASLRSLLTFTQRNRSPYENRNHAAACDCISQAGRRDGAASPCRAASWAAARQSSTLRFWGFDVATPVTL